MMVLVALYKAGSQRLVPGLGTWWLGEESPDGHKLFRAEGPEIPNNLPSRGFRGERGTPRLAGLSLAPYPKTNQAKDNAQKTKYQCVVTWPTRVRKLGRKEICHLWVQGTSNFFQKVRFSEIEFTYSKFLPV
jgi:hypothetical protein